MGVMARVCNDCGSFPCRCRVTPMDVLAKRPTSALSEVDLFSGGVGRDGRQIFGREERCACGGLIRVADRDDGWLIGRTVRLHNESTRHAHWATKVGLR